MSVKKYCYCENNCKYETMSKEEILAAIAQAVETGTVGECDTGFITTIKTINGQPLKFFVGEQSEYEALTADQKSDLFALITNDTTKEGLLNSIAELNTKARELENWKKAIMSGEQAVSYAIDASNATNADYALSADRATNADHATSADRATNADHATSANHATSAEIAIDATRAESADHATSADIATNATKLSNLSKENFYGNGTSFKPIVQNGVVLDALVPSCIYFAQGSYNYPDGTQGNGYLEMLAHEPNDFIIDGKKPRWIMKQTFTDYPTGRVYTRTGYVIPGNENNIWGAWVNLSNGGNAATADIIKPPTSNIKTVKMTCDAESSTTSRVDVDLEDNKTYLFMVTGGNGYKYTMSFIMNRPTNDNYATSSIFSFENKTVKFDCRGHSSGNTTLSMYMLDGSLWKYFTLISPLELTIEYYAIATI